MSLFILLLSSPLLSDVSGHLVPVLLIIYMSSNFPFGLRWPWDSPLASLVGTVGPHWYNFTLSSTVRICLSSGLCHGTQDVQESHCTFIGESQEIGSPLSTPTSYHSTGPSIRVYLFTTTLTLVLPADSSTPIYSQCRFGVPRSRSHFRLHLSLL